MCGIFAYFGNNKLTEKKLKLLDRYANYSQHRGPDNTNSLQINDTSYFVFHRLMINDQSSLGNQPLVHPDDKDIILICNGEIYNFKDLCHKNNFNMYSGSDCEVIIHMYKKFGIEETVKNLDGVFAFVLFDRRNNQIWCARDPIGVRSLYIAKSENGIAFSSELKSIVHGEENIFEANIEVEQFPPGSFYELNSGVTVKYYEPNALPIIEEHDEKVIMSNIRDLLIKATKKRLLGDRKIGCLLSGGLDSSLIAGILATLMPPGELETFSIGLEGSVDLEHAQMVADYLGTNHHQVVVSEEEMLGTIEEDIHKIESYDTTTIRASTPMYILSKYIRDNSDAVVIFSGEGSDEASGSYMYFHNAPSPEAFKDETFRLMDDMCYFDVLRCDKSTAGAGLEVRVPFLDKDFLKYYLQIDPKLKMPKTYEIEKYLLRKAFDADKIIPDKVLWRTKEGMSDGVSSKKKPWYGIIQDSLEVEISDEDFKKRQAEHPWNPPKFKESLHYRELYIKHFGKTDSTVPYYWLPKWCGDIDEPSARVLNCYDTDKL